MRTYSIIQLDITALSINVQSGEPDNKLTSAVHCISHLETKPLFITGLSCKPMIYIHIIIICSLSELIPMKKHMNGPQCLGH